MHLCLTATTEDRIKLHTKQYNWSVSGVTGIKDEYIKVIRKSNTGYFELWLNSKYKNYRNAFVKYLEQYYGITDPVIKKYDVDHMLPISRLSETAPKYFIKLFLLDKSINRSYGACFERIQNKHESEKAAAGGFHLSCIGLLKVLGIKIPKKDSTSEERDQWAINTAKYFEKIGLEEWEINYPILLCNINDGYRDKNCSRTIESTFGIHQIRRIYK